MYRVKRIIDEEDSLWLDLIKISKQKTPFHNEEYLQAVGCSGDRYVVLKKDRVILGIVLAVNSSGQIVLPPFTPYLGVLFKDGDNSYKSQKEQLEAMTVLLEVLEEKYTKISFVNHFSVLDMRACLWHHYHEADKPKYGIFLQYTAIKDILHTEQDIVNSLSKGRRLDYRYARERYGLNYVEASDFSDFYKLYNLTFARQNINLHEEEFECVKRIIGYTQKSNEGFLRYAVDQDGNVIDAVYILVCKKTAYYLFGANHPDYRKYGGGTFLLVEAMKELSGMGIKYFDFVGINSPYRGDFKLSFGAEIKPYYVCEKR